MRSLRAIIAKQIDGLRIRNAKRLRCGNCGTSGNAIGSADCVRTATSGRVLDEDNLLLIAGHCAIRHHWRYVLAVGLSGCWKKNLKQTGER